MSQPPYGPPGQNPPYQQNPQYQQPGPPPPQGQYGPPQQYGAPQYTPQYGPPRQQGPGYGWGPGFGPGPGRPGWQPPRRKKSKAPLIAIFAIVAVGIVGATLIGLVRKAANDVTTPPVTPTRYTPKPTGAPTGRPTSTSTGSPTQASSETIVAKNAIYNVGQMASVNCHEPKVRPTSAKNAAAYWAALKPCLDQSWKPLVEKAGYTFESPQMTYWSGTTVTNPCGGGAISVPFFCSANNMLYMKVDVFVQAYTEYPGDPIAQAYARMWYSRSLAHEFGHGVQNMTGILQAASKLRYEQTDYAGQTRMTRRMELQANCFAGVFLAVNKASYPINGNMLYVWNKYVVTAGDKPEEGDHGSVASQGRFMGQSFKTGNPASCNTFSASPANVS
ncbi:putative metalloprotease [Kribbella aluminosa]|uniref:Metalloprotease n=1 Tax=Kribbella aluminosa TaxID=416017 RepID=A0ABS4UUH6_9ACTN|nr:neutral zinc metallopeptidase [Kribbella aluminosa]MBP2355297.1 putative metalloprotease [Kribbella aluminosa]